MKTPVIAVAVVVAATVFLWVLQRSRPPGPDNHRGQTVQTGSTNLPLTSSGIVALPSGRTGSAAGQAQPVVAVFGTSTSEWAMVEALLARPEHRPLMREVPRLSAQSEARLIALYREGGGPWSKRHIVDMLAFGGGSASAQVFREALTRDFAGKVVSPGDNSILCYVPQLCGVLARRNEDALRFLLEASRPEFWLAQRLWGGDQLPVSVRILTGAAIKGLGLSGRREAQELLDWYRNNPAKAGVRERDGTVDSLDGAIVDAFFKAAIVEHVGIEVAMDEVFYDPHVMMRRFGEWLKTPEGRAWFAWAAGAQQAGLAAARQANGGQPATRTGD
jgi:hypothetical protein